GGGGGGAVTTGAGSATTQPPSSPAIPTSSILRVVSALTCPSSRDKMGSSLVRRDAGSHHLYLAHPGGVGDLPPARPDARDVLVRQRAGLEQRGVLGPALGARGADDRGVHAGHAQREAQCGAHRVLAAQEVVVERAQPHPVVLVVRLARLARVAPGDV